MNEKVKGLMYYFVIGVALGIGTVGIITGNMQSITHMFLLLILITLIAIGERIK